MSKSLVKLSWTDVSGTEDQTQLFAKLNFNAELSIFLMAQRADRIVSLLGHNYQLTSLCYGLLLSQPRLYSHTDAPGKTHPVSFPDRYMILVSG